MGDKTIFGGEMAPGPPKKETAQKTTRVALVDEYPIFSEALSVVISSQSDLEVVGCATTPEDAMGLVARFGPDVVVVDIDVATTGNAPFDGIDMTKQIKASKPDVRVLILTGLMDLDVMARAAGEGACGFLSKSSTVVEICHAIRTAKDGGMFVEQELVGPLLERLSRGRPIGGGSARADLTPREQNVLTLLGEGLDVSSIAKRLGISLNTCRGHVKSLLVKLGCHSQLEAVVEAVHQGLLPHLSR